MCLLNVKYLRLIYLIIFNIRYIMLFSKALINTKATQLYNLQVNLDTIVHSSGWICGLHIH